MSDKALFVKVKNIEEAMFLQLLEESHFGYVHHIGESKKDNCYADKGDVVAVVTSFDSYMLDEIIEHGLHYAFLDNLLYYAGEEQVNKLYISLI